MAKGSRTRSQKKPSKSVSTSGAKSSMGGLKVERVFSDAGCSPFDQVDWDKRSVAITDESGKVVSSKYVPLGQKGVLGKYSFFFVDIRHWASFKVVHDSGYLIVCVSLWMGMGALLLRYAPDLIILFGTNRLFPNIKLDCKNKTVIIQDDETTDIAQEKEN